MQPQFRLGTLEDVPTLECAREPGSEPIPWYRATTVVAEVDGQIVGYAAARLCWVLEPLTLTPEGKALKKNTQRRVVRGLAVEMERSLSDRIRNRTGIFEYICRISSRKFQNLARHWGCDYWYEGGKWFHKNLMNGGL